MRYSQSLIAKQYAKAYILEFGSSLQWQDIERLTSVMKFCRRHHTFMSLVSELTTKDLKRHVLVDDMFAHFSLPDSLKKLVDIMVVHKRLPLFSSVVQDICCLYLEKNNMLEVTISTATDLDADELKKFEDFFMKLSGKKIISHVIIDESLIAGVRMQSDVLLWEYSIAARIRLLAQQVDLTS